MLTEVDRFRAANIKQVHIERIVKNIIKESLPLPYYIIFGKEAANRSKKHKGVTLLSEIDILQRKWAARGLNPLFMDDIKDALNVPYDMTFTEAWLNSRYLRLDCTNSPLTGNLLCRHLIPNQDGTAATGGYVYGYRSFSVQDPISTSRMYWGNINFLDAFIIFGAQESVPDVIDDTGTATGGTNLTLVDTTKAWVVNAHVGRTLRKRHFLANGGVHEEYGVIVSNTATVITVANPFLIDAAAGDLYDIAVVGVRTLQIGTTLRPTEISCSDDVFPRPAASIDIGKATAFWRNLYLSGNLSDGVNTASVAQCKTAYDHSQVTSGNPHQVRPDYNELMQVISPGADGAWTTIILNAYGIADGDVVEVLMENTSTSRDLQAGVRAAGSALVRVAVLDEAELGGGRSGITMHVKAIEDEDEVQIQLYEQDDSDITTHIIGFWH